MRNLEHFDPSEALENIKVNIPVLLIKREQLQKVGHLKNIYKTKYKEHLNSALIGQCIEHQHGNA
jgi:hypothetical protein